MQHTRRRVGRPRDPQVEARDKQIYQLIAEGTQSRRALAEATGLDRPTIALSVQRLKRAGHIKPCHGTNGAAVWAIDDGTPCP